MVGWLDVSPGRWFPFLNGVGPSPLYRGGEPAHVIEEIVRVVQQEIVLEVKEHEIAYLEGKPDR